MSDRLEQAAMLLLLRHGRRDRREYAGLVEEAASALTVLDAEGGLLARDELRLAAADIQRWAELGIRVHTVLDPTYPENLRAVFDRPPLIFVGGGFRPSDALSIAVIGSRLATSGGLADATELARHLAKSQTTVISGLAAGVDAAAHRAALQAGGRTIAVLGTGLARAYPAQHAGLQDQIARDGAIVSQFLPDTRPSRHTFPLRNATMSGLSLATVVVEASERSGSRIQTGLALRHGRPVFLYERLLRYRWAQELRERPGVHIATEPEEITEALPRLTSTNALTA